MFKILKHLPYIIVDTRNAPRSTVRKGFVSLFSYFMNFLSGIKAKAAQLFLLSHISEMSRNKVNRQ